MQCTYKITSRVYCSVKSECFDYKTCQLQHFVYDNFFSVRRLMLQVNRLDIKFELTLLSILAGDSQQVFHILDKFSYNK